MAEVKTLYRGDEMAHVDADSDAEATMKALGFHERPTKAAREAAEAAVAELGPGVEVVPSPTAEPEESPAREMPARRGPGRPKR